MAGRRRYKSDGSGNLIIGVLMLIVIGWVITNIKLVLFLVAFVGVVIGLYFMIKWGARGLSGRETKHQLPQQDTIRPVQPPMPLDGKCKWELPQSELGKLDSVVRNEIIQARLESTAKVNQQIERQKFGALPVIDTNHSRKLHGMPLKEVATQITSTPKTQNKPLTAPASKRTRAVPDTAKSDETKEVLVFTARPSLASLEEIALANAQELEAKLRKLEEKIRE